MPNYNRVFQEEVRRLARKEFKQTAVKLMKEVAALKRTITDQKRRIATLERDNKRLVRHMAARREMEIKPERTEIERARITSAQVRRVRQRLGLTQAQFAKLLGVSGQAVYQWESKEGRLRLRSGPRAAFIEARKLGAREARRRLA